MYLGLDGYRHGWVAVTIDREGRGRLEFLQNIRQLEGRKYVMVMIDIPIGLPRSGNRKCDLEARKLLQNNYRRVFTGARRSLLASLHSYEEANGVGRQLGAGVSKQLFCLLPKIKEIDDFIDNDRQRIVREAHPELVFLRLSGYRSVPRKKTTDGLDKRLSLLRRQIVNIDTLLPTRIGTGAKLDDVLDACACAIAARDNSNGSEHVVPLVPEFDGRGLRMQIWY